MVSNYLQQNYDWITANVRRMVLEMHGEIGDIKGEAYVISAIMGDTRIKKLLTCSNQICQEINPRMKYTKDILTM